MSYKIECKNIDYFINDKKILKDISFSLEPGTFTVLLGENGSGKSTLLDVLVGFRVPQLGEVQIEGVSPQFDNLELKRNTIFLSEKMEVPVYWKIQDYLDFHKAFYPTYSDELEERFLTEYKLSRKNSFRSLSAGEAKRAQIIAALASQPKLMMVDEITAVLDIVGRLKFMSHLKELKDKGTTVLMATNILEDQEHHASHLLLLKHGEVSYFGSLAKFLAQKPHYLFSQRISEILEAA